ncbi:MAG: hypothetical protein EXQ91_01645, partial [Alphaproteobacteria bacterium]|nr:hypothetical protein [Alphaproteobacteria bacterium]
MTIKYLAGRCAMRNSFGNSFRLMSGLVAAAITGLAAVGSASGEPLRVKLEWLPGAIHAWYHLAAEKGWYKEAGLDVEIEDGKGSTVGIQLVGAGNFE